LNLVETNGDATLVQGMQAAQWDLADGGLGAPIAATLRGGGFRFVAGQCARVFYAMYAQPSIQAVTDLKGKYVGIAALGSAPHAATVGWLKTYNLNASDVEFVSLGPTPEVFRAVLAGKVDAGVAGIDYLPLAKRQGLSVLSDRIVDELPNFIVLAFYARPADLANADQRDRLIRFLSAMAKTHRAFYDPANKDTWIAVGAKLQNREPDDLAFFYDWAREKRLFAANLEFTREQIQGVQELNLLLGSQDRVLPFDDVATYDLQRAVLERIGEYRYS
jgi:ABC-type nitrate/sulfonate/bicarbonate transport system substrate-binding protein